MKKKKRKIYSGFHVVFCIFMLLLFVFPYLNIFFSSFKPPLQVVSTSPTFFPKTWVLENYSEAFGKMNLFLFFKNSFISSTISTFLALAVGSMAAYAISRLKGRKMADSFLTFTLFMRIVPLISIAIPMFSISLTVGMYDKVVFLVAFYTAFQLPFVIWMMQSFFDSLPGEIEEAAMVDGCNTRQVFTKIILPMAGTGLTSTAILSFIMPWNDFLFALFVTGTKAKTLPVALSELVTAFEVSLAPMTAIAVFFSIPLIILTMFLQKYIINGMTVGAVKG